MAALPAAFGLVVAGFDKWSGRWYNLAELQELASNGQQWDVLNDLVMRLYGPQDYLARWRGHFIEEAGFEMPPQLRLVAAPLSRAELRRARLSQGQLAQELGVSAPFVSQILNNKRPWPQGLQERALAIVAARPRPAAGSTLRLAGQP